MVDTFAELEHRLQHLLDAHPKMYSYFEYVASWEVGLEFNAKYTSERYKKHSCTKKEKGQSYTNCVQQVDDMIDRMSKTMIDQTMKSYYNRVEELRGFAKEENTKIDIDSETCFWSFLDKMPLMRKGQIVLSKEGYISIIWDDDKGNYIHITFCGRCLLALTQTHREVRYVVCVMGDKENTIQETGNCSLREAEELIDKHDLRFLVRIKHD